jgi:hypothetical protein
VQGFVTVVIYLRVLISDINIYPSRPRREGSVADAVAEAVKAEKTRIGSIAKGTVRVEIDLAVTGG